jgi:hypothetical protein
VRLTAGSVCCPLLSLPKDDNQKGALKLLRVGFLMVAVLAATVRCVWPCTVAALAKPEDLVGRAQAIVRARAEGLADVPGQPGVFAGSRTQVRFTVLEILKGTLNSRVIWFNGTLDERSNLNMEHPRVPYQQVRSAGHASCFATTYRPGAEYLLFLNRAEHEAYPQRTELTPYWVPLGPTNEELSMSNDPWLRWVAEAIKRGATR